MHKILIIDDNNKRLIRIKNLLTESLDDIEIHQAENVVQAKLLLKNNYYFTLFLDMALPHRNGDSIDNNAGIKLLASVARGRFNKIPGRVIGFTALAENIEEKESKFEQLGFKLYESKTGDYSWVDKALAQVQYSLQAIKSYNELPSDIAVLSVHGIETGGDWQKILYSQIAERFTSNEISNLQYQYKEYPVTRFAVPLMRNKMVHHFREQLVNWLNDNKAKKIVCFAHSFGTFILIKALESIEDKSILKNIDLILLSGSVLKQNHDFSFLKSLPNSRLVNDCAKQDGALLFSKAFVVGTGFGGRIGFRGLTNNKFVNRTYQGGHSVFFENDCEILKKYWLPLLEPNSNIQPFNKAINRRRDKVVEYLARISAKIKYAYYILFISALYFITKLGLSSLLF